MIYIPSLAAAIAKVCHEANKACCEIHGDTSQKSWEDAEEWQRLSAIRGVEFALDNPNALASSQHDAWSKDKLENGWKCGPIKDAIKKEHPCLVPFDSLPPEQKLKDYLFKAVVKSFVDADCMERYAPECARVNTPFGNPKDKIK